MKHTKKRVAALLLTLAMVLSLMPMALAADEYPDGMPAEDDASYAAVKSAVDNGIISGENGSLNLDGNIIRSTMAAMVTRTFGAKGETTLSGYSDVDDSHWAVQQGALPAAVQMGIMSGNNGKMLANDPVTREQAWAMLARALKLEKGTAADLEGVPGADSLSTWAIPEIASLVKAQYISDVSNATEPMTRVEFAEVIYSVSGGNYVKEDGDYTEDVDGNIIITANGVSLKGITVKGDVIIADGVDAGSITLDGVKIEGRLLVRGGSEVALTNGTTAASTVVAKTSDEVTVSADKASDAGSITVDAKADKVTVNMPEPTVTVASATEVAVQNAEGGSVTLAASGASVAVESGTLENVTVADGASDVKVDVAKGATIEMVTTNTDITITGDGTVEEKEGSGTVTDASGNEVGGSDEPANVPTVSGSSSSEPEGPAAPDQTAHVHNYAAVTDGSATQLNSTHHLLACVTHGSEGDEDYVAGCGAVVAMPHNTDGDEGACSACGYKASTTTSTKDSVEETGEGFCTGGHSWDNGTVTPFGDGENACNTSTVTTYHCTNKVSDADDADTCAATYTVTTTPSGHNYLQSSYTPATCKTDGTQVFTCTVCDAEAAGHTKTVTIAKESVAHTYSTSAVTKAATCQADGVRTWTCSVCEDTTTEPIAKDANAHSWGAWSSTTDKDGNDIHTRSCGVDGCTETQTHSPAPAASWSSNDTNHWHICTVAGCTEKVGNGAHDWGTEENPSKTCKVCGKPNTAPVEEEKPEPAKHEHDWQNGECKGANAPDGGCTCSKAGSHDGLYVGQTCSECKVAGKKAVSECPNAENHGKAEGGDPCGTCGTANTVAKGTD